MVSLYGTPACRQCGFVMFLFDRKGVEYTYIDLSLEENEHLLERFSAGSSLPIIKWHDGKETYGLDTEGVTDRISHYLASTIKAAA